MKHYYSETTGNVNVKWSASLVLGPTALSLMASDNVNRHEFLPAVRTLLSFEAGENKGENSKGQVIPWSDSDKAAFQIQRNMLDSDEPVVMLRFVSASDNDLRAAVEKYDASPLEGQKSKTTYCNWLVGRGRLGVPKDDKGQPLPVVVPDSLDALIAAVREHDAAKLIARRDQAVKDFESGTVKLGKAKKVGVNANELL